MACLRSAYDQVARGFGAEGVVVKHPDEVAAALRRPGAWARRGRPVLINLRAKR